jgi:rhodanese-related sulfurtransferase
MRVSIIFLLLLSKTLVLSQNTIPQVLEKLTTKSVPFITVNELQSHDTLIVLDAREIKEFEVSHIENAIHIGYDKFDSKNVTSIIKDKNTKIVVYCSIGVRSEKIGEKLLKLGYKNVFNLYGGIFEWKNQGGTVVNNQNSETDEIHTFNKEWSVYLQKGTKVYEN